MTLSMSLVLHSAPWYLLVSTLGVFYYDKPEETKGKIEDDGEEQSLWYMWLSGDSSGCFIVMHLGSHPVLKQ